jgi:hypothetical protein
VNEQDQPGADDPAFDDPAFDDVRALLADARATGPVPDEVAARLDATLSSLQAERASEGTSERTSGGTSERTSGTVVPLRGRLRRGASRALVAAAALVLVGAGAVGIAQLAGDSGGSADSAATADRAQDGAGGTGSAPEATDAPAQVPRSADAARTIPELSTTTFAADAARVMVDLAGERVAETAGKAATAGTDGLTGELDTRSPTAGYAIEAPPVTASPQDASKSLTSLESCAGPEAPDAVTVPATLDGGRIALVFRPPTASGQRVEAWSCDGGTLLQAATVPTAAPR